MRSSSACETAEGITCVFGYMAASSLRLKFCYQCFTFAPLMNSGVLGVIHVQSELKYILMY